MSNNEIEQVDQIGLLIPSSIELSAFIGKNGHHIKTFSKKHKCKSIQVVFNYLQSTSYNQHCHLIIFLGSIFNIISAIHSFMIDYPMIISLEFMIPKECRGYVIGQNGHRISDFQQYHRPVMIHFSTDKQVLDLDIIYGGIVTLSNSTSHNQCVAMYDIIYTTFTNCTFPQKWIQNIT